MRSGSKPDPETEQLIRELRAEVRALTLRIQDLEARTSILEESDFELVPSAASASSPGPSEVARASPPRSEPAVAATTSSRLPPEGPVEGASEQPIQASDIEARVALAKETGLFLRRSVEGGFRGLSGRNRLRLQSRLYVVLSDSAGQPFTFSILSGIFGPPFSLGATPAAPHSSDSPASGKLVLPWRPPS